MIMNKLCTKKEVASVPRAFGWTRRVDAKTKQPNRKELIDMRDLSHPNGFDAGWPDAPRARKMVLPSEVSRSHWVSRGNTHLFA